MVSGTDPAMLAAKGLVGRDRELQAVREALTATPAPVAIVLEGAAGIGKTTIWRAGMAEAATLGHRLLTAQPSASETGLSNAALSDLLGPLMEGLRGALPAPQRAALDVALLRSTPTASPAEPRAVGAGTVTLLRSAAESAPLMLAVDDLQWLDAASAAALRFALRRLAGERVTLLATERLIKSTERVDLDVPEERVRRVAVGPLGRDALERLVRGEIGNRLPRPLLARLVGVSGGNPHYALELARAALRHGVSDDSAREFRLPEDISAVLRDRLATLPLATRDAVGVVAAMGDPTIAAMAEAVDASRLDPAFDAGILHEADEAIRFDHPLLAEAAYRGLAQSRRRAVHEQLADISRDAEGRARHLATAATRPDAKVAEAIAEGAAAATARGAPSAAAELLEASARVEPDSDLSASRRLDSVKRHMAAGNGHRAAALASALIEELPPGPLRSRVLVTRSQQHGSVGEQLAATRSAVEEAGDDVEARIEALLAEEWVLFTELRVPEAFDRLRSAREICGPRAGRELRVRVLTAYGDLAAMSGESGALELVRSAVELEAGDLIPDAYSSPRTVLGRALLFADELDAAGPLLAERERRAAEAGDDESRSGLLLHLCELECRAGRFDEARRHAEEGLALVDASYGEFGQAALVYGLALVAAYQGDEESARSLAERGLAQAEAQGDELFAMESRTTLGLLELSLENHAAALEWLGPIPDRLEKLGMTEPGKPLCHADAIEALIGLGRLEEADDRLVAWEATGRRLDRPRVHATAARARALVAAARGDLNAALGHAQVALEHHKLLPDPLERARTLIVLGMVHRRAKRKAAARAALEEALESLEGMGALLWARRAQSELGRIGGRSRAGGLTPTEQRVADLVAEGGTNREVADALFVTVRTVEANLTRIYAKLGIRSRTELASRRGA